MPTSQVAIGTITSATQVRQRNIQNGNVWEYWFEPRTNSVNVGYTNVGTSPVVVQIDYTTVNWSWSGGSATGATYRTLPRTDLASGGPISWEEPPDVTEVVAQQGGINSMQPVRVRVYARDAQNNYTVLVRDSAVSVGGGRLQ